MKLHSNSVILVVFQLLSLSSKIGHSISILSIHDNNHNLQINDNSISFGPTSVPTQIITIIPSTFPSQGPTSFPLVSTTPPSATITTIPGTAQVAVQQSVSGVSQTKFNTPPVISVFISSVKTESKYSYTGSITINVTSIGSTTRSSSGNFLSVGLTSFTISYLIIYEYQKSSSVQIIGNILNHSVSNTSFSGLFNRLCSSSSQCSQISATVQFAMPSVSAPSVLTLPSDNSLTSVSPSQSPGSVSSSSSSTTGLSDTIIYSVAAVGSIFIIVLGVMISLYFYTHSRSYLEAHAKDPNYISKEEKKRKNKADRKAEKEAKKQHKKAASADQLESQQSYQGDTDGSERQDKYFLNVTKEEFGFDSLSAHVDPNLTQKVAFDNNPMYGRKSSKSKRQQSVAEQGTQSSDKSNEGTETKPFKDLSTEELQVVLSTLSMNKYIPQFARTGINGAIAANILSFDDLIECELDIPKPVARAFLKFVEDANLKGIRLSLLEREAANYVPAPVVVRAPAPQPVSIQTTRTPTPIIASSATATTTKSVPVSPPVSPLPVAVSVPSSSSKLPSRVPLSSLTAREVGYLVSSLRLEMFAKSFYQNNITGAELVKLKVGDLTKRGVQLPAATEDSLLMAIIKLIEKDVPVHLMQPSTLTPDIKISPKVAAQPIQRVEVKTPQVTETPRSEEVEEEEEDEEGEEEEEEEEEEGEGDEREEEEDEQEVDDDDDDDEDDDVQVRRHPPPPKTTSGGFFSSLFGGRSTSPVVKPAPAQSRKEAPVSVKPVSVPAPVKATNVPTSAPAIRNAVAASQSRIVAPVQVPQKQAVDPVDGDDDEEGDDDDDDEGVSAEVAERAERQVALPSPTKGRNEVFSGGFTRPVVTAPPADLFKEKSNADKNKEYFAQARKAENEAKRLKEEQERGMDEGAYLAKKQAEAESKAHDTQKVSHYAKLGSAFAKGKGDNLLSSKRPNTTTSPATPKAAPAPVAVKSSAPSALPMVAPTRVEKVVKDEAKPLSKPQSVPTPTPVSTVQKQQITPTVAPTPVGQLLAPEPDADSQDDTGDDVYTPIDESRVVPVMPGRSKGENFSGTVLTSPVRPMVGNKDMTAADKNKEHFAQVRKAEAEAKRLREEKERSEDEGAYLAKKLAEQESKVHDTQKVSHYAKLGSAFVKGKGDNPLGGKRPGGLASPTKRN